MESLTEQEIKAWIKQKQANQFLLDLRTVLQTKAGRNIYCWLMDTCRMSEPSFTGNSQTFFNEGMRKVGLELQSQMFLLQDGLDLKHQAEQEYLRRGNQFLLEIQEELRNRE